MPCRSCAARRKTRAILRTRHSRPWQRKIRTSPSSRWILKSFTSRRMIRGWFTDIPWWRGRDGTRIPESGLAAHTCRAESVSESVGTAALDGDGAIGDSIGIIITQSSTTTGTTLAVPRFTTETTITGVAASAADSMAGAVDSITIPAQPGPLTETRARLADTPSRAARAVSAPAPSAATTTADRQGAIRHAEALASVDFTAVVVEGPTGVAGVGSRVFVVFPDRS